MRVLRDQAAGLIIDIQEKLFPFIAEHDRIAANTAILVKGLQAMNIPILVTEQYTKGLGPTVQPVREVFPELRIIEKLAFSCCDDSLFMEELDALGRKYIVIAGIESHVCVLQTTIDLLERNYIPVVVEDCISSRRLNDKALAVARMRKAGAVLTTYESILFELLRYSGTDEFKAISRLVK